MTYRYLRASDDLVALTDLLHEAYAPLAAAGMRFVASHQDVATTQRRVAEGDTIVNVKVRRMPPLETLPAVTRALAEANSALTNNGRIVLRYSGTEPLVRVMVEAEHASEVKKWSESIAAAVRSTIGV